MRRYYNIKGSKLCPLWLLNDSKLPREQIADLSLVDDLKEMEETKRAFNHYIAAQLDGREGYGDLLVTEYNPSSTTEYSSAFPIKENLCPISENNEPMLYDSDFPEKSIGTAIYGNSVRFSEGQGAEGSTYALNILHWTLILIGFGEP